MTNKGYFQLPVSAAQLAYADQLVAHSLRHHTVPNIWDGTRHESLTPALRLTGTLGEVLFADVYGLPRPTRSFGAADGQDLGKDFEWPHAGLRLRCDLKTMRRKTNRFYDDYVLNIPASQVHRADAQTDVYFHLSLHSAADHWVMTFVGYAFKADLIQGRTGQLFGRGSLRTRADGTQFAFYEDTYEISLGDLHSPPIPQALSRVPGFAQWQMRRR